MRAWAGRWTAVAALPPVVVALTGAGGPRAWALVVAAVVAVALVWIGLFRPAWLAFGAAVALGAAPLADLPVVDLPIGLTLVAGVLAAAVIHRPVRRTVHPLELAVLALVVTSTASLLLTGLGAADLLEYTKWLVATGLLAGLLRLEPTVLRRVGRFYVGATAAAATLGIAIVLVPPVGRVLALLEPFGYEGDALAPRFAYVEGGASLRLAGTYVDPNAAGIALFVGLVMAPLVLDGRRRVVVLGLLAVALTLTLSRATLFSAVAAAVLVVLFHPLSARARRAAALGGLGVLVAAAATPTVRTRLLSSFGPSDAGTTARWDAFQRYPGYLEGHWWFGLGWGRPEFVDQAAGYSVNFVANAPLLTVYRGGVLTGLAFVLVLVVGSVLGYRLMRTDDLRRAWAGGGFVGFALVALQLDFPVVTIPSVTTLFTFLLVALVIAEDLPPDPATPRRSDAVRGLASVRR